VRILQISSARALGGGETHFIELVRGLRRRGHEVHLALSNNSPIRAALEPMPPENISMLPLRNALDAASARQLARIVREQNIQVIHAHMARDYPLAAFAARMNRGAKLIISRHVLFPLSRLHAVALANVARVIAVSDAVSRKLREQQLFPAEKIAVVRNGIDVERFGQNRLAFDREEFCQHMNIPAHRLLVGTVGEITKLKGHEDFVSALALVTRAVPQAHFIIAGQDHSVKGEHDASLKKRIETLNLTDQVQRFGWIDNLADLYCAIEVFVSASHSESFGLAIVEAMASGTAVVATATDGAREVITDGVNGLLVPIGDSGAMAEAMIDLLGNSERRTRLASAAQQNVREHFTLGRMIAETEQVYRDALGQG